MRALLALVLVALSALPASANDHAWLVGKWELTHAPDGDAKDWVEFTPEGQTMLGPLLKGRPLRADERALRYLARLPD